MSEQTHHILNTYLRRLTNISGNNRSIFLPRVQSEQYLDIHQISQLNGEKSFSIVETLIARKEKTLCPVMDARMESANDSSKKIKRLQRIDHLIFEERGSKDLHVGWPFVHGKFVDGTLVRCPLLYFPVEIENKNNQWSIRMRPEANVSFNKAFILAYAYFNQIEADDELMEESFDEVNPDSTVFRTQLYQLLQKSKLEIHFNPDTYRDELIDFKNYKKEEFEGLCKNGILKLFPECVLGIFPQAGSYLVPDYQTLLKQHDQLNLEELFAQRSSVSDDENSPSSTKKIPEEKMYPVLAMDAWQEKALKEVKSGHSLVVHGPPGTGKSQLICNLIADAIANKKKILVVCQKRAALDVVYQRMEKENLADFLALVHDFKNDRNPIYQKLAQQVDRIDEYKRKNNSLDSIQLERKFLQTSHRIDQILEELEEFKTFLFDESECKTSIKQLYLRSSADQPSINLVQEYQQFDFASLEVILHKFKVYAHYAEKFLQSDYKLRDRKSLATSKISDLKEIQKAMNDVPAFVEDLTAQMTQWLIVPLSWNQCEAWLEDEKEIWEIIELLKDPVVHRYFVAMLKESEEEVSELWLANSSRMIKDCFENEGPEISLHSHQLGAFQKALYQRMRARKSLYGLIRWELFSKEKILLRRVLVANGLPNNKHGYRAIERKLDLRLNLEHNLSKLRKKKWLLGTPSKIDQQELAAWFEHQKKALQASHKYRSKRGIKNILDPGSFTATEFLKQLKSLMELLQTIPAKKISWSAFLSNSQISTLANHPEQASELRKVLSEDFDALCEFDAMQESLASFEREILQKLHEAAGDWNGDKLNEIFYNSLALAWIDHIETKHPVLRIVSSGKLQLLETELRKLIQEKQNESNEILLMRARESVSDDLEFNRLNNRTTYRDLYHQVMKKKKIWPIRKLISEFSDEVFRLAPCWLASPESVSAMMPMQQLFDVVVFDEASQCFAEKGIPAIFRGKQIVIAGDEKQLRPMDIYQVRWQGIEDEDEPDLEVESLLELAGRYLKNVNLQAHYRSQNLELIDFSNKHFYNGTLKLLPDFQQLQENKPSIEYHKVEGFWSNQTNEKEADHIAKLVFEVSQKTPDKSIGVISFNAPQQMLVMDKVEDHFSRQKKSIPASLFIKNIENVQGDEKDIIIFSIGYARDQKGKVNVQFGSLNAAGGENRLNVAVTRAREKIIVVCSIQPEELNVADTKNEGPKLLREYLAYARMVSEKKFEPYLPNDPLSKTNVYLRQEIRRKASERHKEFQFDESLPFADLSVFRKDQPLGLILTDDEIYRQSLSAKDPHASVPTLLEKKNWKHVMTYSRNYWQDPDKVIQEVGKFTLPLNEK